MIISVNWLKQYVDIDLPINELATLIGARLVEIEEIIDLGKKYQGIIIAEIMNVEKHPNADRLNVCKIDDGGRAQNVERDEGGYIQVVCGAPNVRAGLFVAWLPPGSTVPSSLNEDEPFILEARELRGVVSNGMLASEKELDLSDSHLGIMEIPESIPGNLFADVYLLNDVLLDIENKSLTHRPDTFGIIGFAREVAAIQGKAFTTPDWLKKPENNSKSEGLMESINVNIDDPSLSKRYQAVVLSNVEEQIEIHPLMSTWLARSGVRPISPVVDVTNYLMLVTGQPLHAFDYDKLLAVNRGKIDIHVRGGREGEKLILLDGRTIELDPSDIVISNGDTAVALAGAMGGSATSIDKKTKRVLLESATFNLYNLRATQMRHGIFSEAITRFTKGPSPELSGFVLQQAVHLLKSLTEATVLSAVAEAYPDKSQLENILLTTKELNQTLGSHYSDEQIIKTLKDAEFVVEQKDSDLKVTVPYWRTDIHIKQDIFEEVGRINGFDAITPVLPVRPFIATQPSALESLKQQLRGIMARAGANDVLSYSFVHGDLLEKVGQKTENSYRIVNAISPRLQYYRQTLTPSLLELIHSNSKAGFDEFALFEINKTHNKIHNLTDERLPGELEMFAFVYANKKPKEGAPFYKAKRHLDFLAAQLGLGFDYSVINDSPEYPVTSVFNLERSAYVREKKSGVFVGIIGEYLPRAKKKLKLPDYTAGFELGTEDILKAVLANETQYTPLGKYQGTSQDITIEVAGGIYFDEVQKAIEIVLAQSNFESTVTPLGVYQKDELSKCRFTFRLSFIDPRRTIDIKKVSSEVSRIIKVLENEFAAKII